MCFVASTSVPSAPGCGAVNPCDQTISCDDTRLRRGKQTDRHVRLCSVADGPWASEGMRRVSFVDKCGVNTTATYESLGTLPFAGRCFDAMAIAASTTRCSSGCSAARGVSWETGKGVKGVITVEFSRSSGTGALCVVGIGGGLPTPLAELLSAVFWPTTA